MSVGQEALNLISIEISNRLVQLRLQRAETVLTAREQALVDQGIKAGVTGTLMVIDKFLADKAKP